jgi:hypothetical protein
VPSYGQVRGAVGRGTCQEAGRERSNCLPMPAPLWLSAFTGTGGQPRSYGIFSPASIATGSRFSGGGSGQVARSV